MLVPLGGYRVGNYSRINASHYTVNSFSKFTHREVNTVIHARVHTH